MLRSLLPKSYHKFLSLPLLGPITDDFDDWLVASGFTRGSRKFSIRMLPRVDANLRRRRVDKVAKPSAMVSMNWRAASTAAPVGCRGDWPWWSCYRKRSSSKYAKENSGRKWR
jgi:hypothetical protein